MTDIVPRNISVHYFGGRWDPTHTPGKESIAVSPCQGADFDGQNASTVDGTASLPPPNTKPCSLFFY